MVNNRSFQIWSSLKWYFGKDSLCKRLQIIFHFVFLNIDYAHVYFAHIISSMCKLFSVNKLSLIYAENFCCGNWNNCFCSNLHLFMLWSLLMVSSVLWPRTVRRLVSIWTFLRKQLHFGGIYTIKTSIAQSACSEVKLTSLSQFEWIIVLSSGIM